MKIFFGILLSVSIEASASYIVRFNETPSNKELNAFHKAFQVQQTLNEDLKIYSVVPKQKASFEHTKEMALSLPYVKYIQEDHVVKLRETRPNDTQFSSQWAPTKISAPLAWDLGTGGKDLLGREVVIAVVDEGMDLRHDDLKENIWVNPGEIPGNNVDDDQNGYVDDINGWNADAKNPNVQSQGSWESHATHVAGIAGAKGNNGLNVSGVNWQTKIMSVKVLGDSSDSLTSIVLRAYGYVIKQKKMWLETNGQYGANIVVTNSSFGVDYANCNGGEYPAWNDIYNEMGKLGILSAVATANLNIDVDVKGDVPSACSSPAIISITNTTQSDLRNTGAAYGLKNVDLGAPGTNILSTTPGNQTGTKTGTSMATPVITGSVAFLYTVASEDLIQMSVAQPEVAAQAIKELLLQTVDKIPDLAGKTTTGGRVNLFNAANAVKSFSVSKNVGYHSALQYFLNQ